METVHPDGTPLAAYLEGEGVLESDRPEGSDGEGQPRRNTASESPPTSTTFAPRRNLAALNKKLLPPTYGRLRSKNTLSQIHSAWSSAVNSRLRRADNARFLEHFRYIIVASQLLNEYLDQGSLPPANTDLDGSSDNSILPSVTTSIYGAVVTAVAAFTLVYLIHWTRNSSRAPFNRSRSILTALVVAIILVLGYAYVRRQWLKLLRRNAVVQVSSLTADWQSFEVCTSSGLSLIQEVELVSRGYRLNTPLPPASRLEDHAVSRRCVRLRKALYHAYTNVIPAAIDAFVLLRTLIEEDDLERYFEVYDISAQDVRDASGTQALSVLEDDAESLKSLRVFSYRAGVLRRVTLCSLMALEADGGKSDFSRWRAATDAMESIDRTLAASAEKIRALLTDMETISTPITPIRTSNPPAREKLRSQVRKISALSSGIRALQAKMQILREETNRSIEHSDDSIDLGPNLLAQYESIGADLRELQQAWEAGKASLQSNLTKRERRISSARTSMGSSVAHSSSPFSSIGGLTAVEEGTPADALKALMGERSRSNRSSTTTTTTPPSTDDEVFEAVALPRQRNSAPLLHLSREDRIARMQEERERQATLRARREANTSMLRELESVISLRPKKVGSGQPRITSL